MLFSELYSAYYNTVAAVLAEASAHPISNARLVKIVEKYAFGESTISIPAAFREERWQLLKADGTTTIKNAPTMPLSLLQKRWLKAVACDPRLKLFGDLDFGLDGIEPLFLPSDFIVFDKYSDGDNYTEETYIVNFRMILDAIRKRQPLQIEMPDRKGNPVRRVVLPEYLEYSEKDDKFRLIGSGNRFRSTINLGRIISCKPCEEPPGLKRGSPASFGSRSLTFELTDQRNVLERALLHFAHFEKTAERIGGDKYSVTVNYEEGDESEMVIRVLSFGPMIRVTAPRYFADLIRQKLIQQKSCGQ